MTQDMSYSVHTQGLRMYAGVTYSVATDLAKHGSLNGRIWTVNRYTTEIVSVWRNGRIAR